MGAALAYLFVQGVGVWGNNAPVYWAWDITNFVWWIGIGHAGTLISAILFLFRQKWRTSINRFAEAMTVFAVLCAGLFPAIHTGRPWFDYYLFPIPNQMDMWPNFKSPLMWDVFAVSTYLTISVIFWYIGLIPDFATLRDRSKNLTPQARVWVLRDSGGAELIGTGSTTSGLTSSSPASRRRWFCRFTRSFRSTSRPRSFPVGTPRFSLRTSSPAPSSAVSHSS